MLEVTQEQFARWSFERDQKVGLYSRGVRWETLPTEEQKLYLDEAELYFTMDRTAWPCDILDRLG